MKKQPEITAQTKQNLIDAFWELYSTRRIEKITVKEITTIAGYNRGTFYEYFIDVYDVLEQLENSLLPNPDEFPSIDIAVVPSPLPVNEFIKMYEDNRKYFVVLLGDGGDPSFLRRIKNNIKPKLKQMLVAKGITDDYELDYTLEYTLSAMNGVLSYYFRQENPPPTDKVLRLMNELMRNGVMPKLSKV